MLLELRIKNFTIIDDITINFAAGFNVLTGETGAGKSIIVDAIGLILGDKASSDMIKTGSKEAIVEAYFDNKNYPLLEDIDIDSDDGIIIRRSISAQGKGRAYINDRSVSLQTLAAICEGLISIHGQHEHQGLLRKDNHLLFLDTFGGLIESSTHLEALYDEVAVLRSKVNELKERIRERNQQAEFLRFQINEIDSANLRNGEKEAAQEEMNILLNLTKLKESSELAYSLLYESEDSCINKLSGVLLLIKNMAHFDHSAKELLDIIEAAAPQIKDAALLLRKFKDKYDADPKKLSELDERLELIKRLQKKYGEDVAGVLKYREQAEKELKTLEHMDEQQEALEADLNLKENALKVAADELSKKRELAAKNMEKMITGELHELGFQKAIFKVSIKKKDNVAANGIDDAEFLFSANPSEPPKPLIKVASGGELSRIMLALKCIEINEGFKDSRGQGVKRTRTLEPSNPRTLIFDEVDAGIGGVTAEHVGKRLKAISKNYQVLCITHLPQIAALADTHLNVQKDMIKNAVKVKIKQLADNERQEELARMMSGKITDISLKHAGELLSAKV